MRVEKKQGNEWGLILSPQWEAFLAEPRPKFTTIENYSPKKRAQIEKFIGKRKNKRGNI